MEIIYSRGKKKKKGQTVGLTWLLMALVGDGLLLCLVL